MIIALWCAVALFSRKQEEAKTPNPALNTDRPTALLLGTLRSFAAPAAG